MFRTKCKPKRLHFGQCKGRKIEACFCGGDITSDAGILLLKQADQRLELTAQLASLLPDDRNQSYTKHSIKSMLQQRIYAIALGYEDLNDQEGLRTDIAMQTAVGRAESLASSSTLCRLENAAERKTAVLMSKLLVELFIKSHTEPPSELILDFDATDDLVHGHQEKAAYHGYYRHHCFLPLYVTCGRHVLVSYLRPCNNDQALHARAILALLVKRLRQVWPQVRITFRADAGFCRHELLDWCDRHDVNYLVGIIGNKKLKKWAKPVVNQAAELFESTQTKQRLFPSFSYRAGTWSKSRRIIAKAEHTAKGGNLRFLVTNLTDDAQAIYDKHYCPRGDMENRIKEQQLELFADRTSAHLWWANQWRLSLSTFAYCLLNYIKTKALVGTSLSNAQCGTIRLKLLKIGAVVIRNTRRIRFLLSSSYPYQELFQTVTNRLLAPG